MVIHCTNQKGNYFLLYISPLHYEAPWICTPPKKNWHTVDRQKKTLISAMGKKHMPHATHYPQKQVIVYLWDSFLVFDGALVNSSSRIYEQSCVLVVPFAPQLYGGSEDMIHDPWCLCQGKSQLTQISGNLNARKCRSSSWSSASSWCTKWLQLQQAKLDNWLKWDDMKSLEYSISKLLQKKKIEEVTYQHQWWIKQDSNDNLPSFISRAFQWL